MQARVLKATSLLVSALILSSCSAPIPAAVSGACPSLPEYSNEVQDKAAAEVEALPADSVLATVMMPDYGSMRDAVRACIAARNAH